MYFLALSQAPPPVVIEIATKSPVTIVPISMPPSAAGPSSMPTRIGTITGSSDGSTISRMADAVSMSPALSVIGPYASSATMMPAIDSIAVAAMAMPYRPPNWNATRIAAHTTSTGYAVDFIDTPSPAMMLVPWPVVDASAMWRTGLNSV